VARGAVHRAPYNAVLYLAAWLAVNAGYVRGRCIIGRIDYASFGFVGLVDMAHALRVEGSDPAQRRELEDSFEPSGHEARAAVDAVYKRKTWGRRPEDIAAQQGLMGDVEGRR
jgi:hypothetical protein